MGLVNELQESAERDDVATVLRKAKRLSSKLARNDIREWLNHEQDGYPSGSQVPDYRVVGVSLCYNTNGYIPAGFGMLRNGIVPLPGFDGNHTLPMLESIGKIIAFIDAMKEGRGGLYVPLSEEMAESIRRQLRCTFPEILDQITFLAHLNSTSVANIPEQVKNKVLDWACTLEAAGVTGEGVAFSEKDKQIASSVIFNIHDSKIEQLNNSGTNLKRVGNG